MVSKPALISDNPEYRSIEDYRAMFDRVPSNLVAYVRKAFVGYREEGVRKNYGVPDIHIAYLADKVEIPLKSGGVEYTVKGTFVRPDDFDNIDEILKRARRMFPG